MTRQHPRKAINPIKLRERRSYLLGGCWEDDGDFEPAFTDAEVAGSGDEAGGGRQKCVGVEVDAVLAADVPYLHTDRADLSSQPKRFLRLRVEIPRSSRGRNQCA